MRTDFENKVEYLI